MNFTPLQWGVIDVGVVRYAIPRLSRCPLDPRPDLSGVVDDVAHLGQSGIENLDVVGRPPFWGPYTRGRPARPEQRVVHVDRDDHPGLGEAGMQATRSSRSRSARAAPPRDSSLPAASSNRDIPGPGAPRRRRRCLRCHRYQARRCDSPARWPPIRPRRCRRSWRRGPRS